MAAEVPRAMGFQTRAAPAPLPDRCLVVAAAQAWEHIGYLLRMRFGRPEVRAGRVRFTSSKILKALKARPDDQAIVEGAMHCTLNPVSLGRWLKDHLVNAPINGRTLRSALGRQNCAQFWIERGV